MEIPVEAAREGSNATEVSMELVFEQSREEQKGVLFEVERR